MWSRDKAVVDTLPTLLTTVALAALTPLRREPS